MAFIIWELDADPTGTRHSATNEKHSTPTPEIEDCFPISNFHPLQYDLNTTSAYTAVHANNTSIRSSTPCFSELAVNDFVHVGHFTFQEPPNCTSNVSSVTGHCAGHLHSVTLRVLELLHCFSCNTGRLDSSLESLPLLASARKAHMLKPVLPRLVNIQGNNAFVQITEENEDGKIYTISLLGMERLQDGPCKCNEAGI
jgi:hypothetical protein